MRIAYFGSSSSFISCLILRELNRINKPVIVVDTVPDTIENKLMSQNLWVTILRYLVIKLFGKQKVSWRWFGNLSGIRIYDINDSKFINQLKQSKVDTILSVGCIQKFGKDLVRDFYCVNYHNSLLPKYRGLYSMSWPIYFKEEFIGFTWHWITEDWDSGNTLVLYEYYNNHKETDNFNNILRGEVKKTECAASYLLPVLELVRRDYRGRLQQGKPSYYGQKELNDLPKDQWSVTCFGWNIAPEEFIPRWIPKLIK